MSFMSGGFLGCSVSIKFVSGFSGGFALRFCLEYFKNSFIEAYIIYHTIHSFTAFCSRASVVIGLCSLQYNPILEYFHYSEKKCVSLSAHSSLLSSLAPGNR